MVTINKKVIADASALLRKGWSQDEYALDAQGNEVIPCADEAVTFCAIGALARVLDTSALAVEEALSDWGISSTILIDTNDSAENVEEVIEALEELPIE
jgi:hypothetical protein